MGYWPVGFTIWVERAFNEKAADIFTSRVSSSLGLYRKVYWRQVRIY